jgi:hypothetical protein
MSWFAPSELNMWLKPPRETDRTSTDDEINNKYSRRELRIVTESNREQLPNFVEALRRPNWMNLKPFYQRRARWDDTRQSRLIESFIMNVPVPPLFVYESDLAKYEVMDGQQRITALLDFYSNKLRLRGLEQWPELNGRIYDNLPTEIKKGIDRRSISYIVLLKESATTSEEQALLRQQVFERLNTGGIELGHQEIRNSLYHGKLNSLLLEVAKNQIFRTAWGIPPYSASEEEQIPEILLKNRTYSEMRDLEIALRFFALRHVENYQRGMKGFLDLYMLRSRTFTDDDIDILRDQFYKTIELGQELYGGLLFHPFDVDKGDWADRSQVAYADAVMVGLSRNLEHAAALASRKREVISKTEDLFRTHQAGTFTGQKNTKKDVQERIRLFDEMLKGVVAN